MSIGSPGDLILCWEDVMTFEQDEQLLSERMFEWYGVSKERVRTVRSPYRICPLGAHIDHQGGNVTGMALDVGVSLAFATNPVPEVKLRSLDFPGEVQVGFEEVPDPTPGDWGNYLRGAVRAMQRESKLKQGMVGITTGRVAEGGLSSSAAVCVAYLLALQSVNCLNVKREQNVAFVQDIENHYLGLLIGILDQSSILFSQRDALTLIDCRETACETIQRPATLPPFTVLIAFSGLRQALVGTDYNRRVAECREAASILLNATGRQDEGPVLSDVSLSEYRQFRHRLQGAVARRAEHFFSEMERVRLGIDAWRRGDLAEFGRLINESGLSSIHNYECGAPPLIDLVFALQRADGVYGARFSGAGFRGCCLALVEPAKAEQIAAQVVSEYRRQHPDLADCAWTMLCQPGDGARIV